MSKIRLYGATSGYVELAAPDVSPDATLTLPPTFGGIGTNVVSVEKTSTFSTTSTSYASVSGLSVTITPTSATSKVLLLYTVPFAFSSGNVETGMLSLFRSTTNLISPSSPGNRIAAELSVNEHQLTARAQMMRVASGHFLDSPNTTSATTYDIRVLTNGTDSFRVNRSTTDSDTSDYPRGVSRLTAIEVAA